MCSIYIFASLKPGKQKVWSVVCVTICPWRWIVLLQNHLKITEPCHITMVIAWFSAHVEMLLSDFSFFTHSVSDGLWKVSPAVLCICLIDHWLRLQDHCRLLTKYPQERESWAKRSVIPEWTSRQDPDPELPLGITLQSGHVHECLLWPGISERSCLWINMAEKPDISKREWVFGSNILYGKRILVINTVTCDHNEWK